MRLKIQTFSLLGGKCVGCGITDIRVLQVNHKNGRGGEKDLFGAEMYQAIVSKIRITEDLDLRCANCNIIYEYECGRRKLPTKL